MDESKFDNIKFDAEEIQILNAFDQNTIKFEPPNDKFINSAKETMRKDKNINIRINDNDLSSIKFLAARDGIPYQTLIGSLIHRYANGRLKDVA